MTIFSSKVSNSYFCCTCTVSTLRIRTKHKYSIF
nr:MAG TPA: hypothetical protein [Crassvirales sp.]